MTSQHAWVTRQRPSRLALRLLPWLIAATPSIPALAQNQDAARALNLFQQLLRPNQQGAAPLPLPVNPALPVAPVVPGQQVLPVNPALPGNAATGVLGNALAGSGAARAAGNAALAVRPVQPAVAIGQPDRRTPGDRDRAPALGRAALWRRKMARWR